MSMRSRVTSARPVLVVIAALAAVVLQGDELTAQGQPEQSPQASAPIDLTGTWVSVVTEEWRWRHGDGTQR